MEKTQSELDIEEDYTPGYLRRLAVISTSLKKIPVKTAELVT